MKKAIDFWKPTKLDGASYYVCENTRDGDAASNHTKTVFELKDVEIQVTPKSLTEADKLNGVEWRGFVSLRYQAVRFYSPSDKSWSEWRGSGYVEPIVEFERINGNLKQPAGQGFSLLTGSYHGGRIGETFGGIGTTTILLAHPKQVELSDLPK